MKKKGNKSCAILWQGFWYKWKKVPHRLSYLGSRFNNFKTAENCCSAYHDQLLKIGNFPKGVADYSSSYSGVHAEDIFIGQGRTSPIEIKTHNQEAGNIPKNISVSLENLESTFDHKLLSSTTHPKVKVLLNGFAIKPIGNDSGWHFGGLGIHVGDAMWNSNKVDFSIEIYMRPAISPEPFPHGNKNKKSKNKWKPKDPYAYAVEVDYTIIIAEEEDFFAESVSSPVEVKKSCDFSSSSLIEHNQGEDLTIVGMEGFKFELSPRRSNAARTGRYIRSLGAAIEHTLSGEKKAVMSFSNTILKNRGWTAAAWNMTANIKTSAMTFRRPVSISRGRISGQTGESADHTFSKRINIKRESFIPVPVPQIA